HGGAGVLRKPETAIVSARNDCGAGLEVGGARLGGRDAGHDLAVDHRQAAIDRALGQAHGALLALVLVGHVVGHRHVLGAQRDALARLLVGAHGPGGAVGVAVGHVVADHVGRLRGRGLGMALGPGPVDHLAADMAPVDPVADVTAGHGATHGGELPAVAAADLVPDQPADDRAGHGAADVAVALGQAFGHDHVVADLARGRGGAGLADRLAAQHLGELLARLGHRIDG